MIERGGVRRRPPASPWRAPVPGRPRLPLALRLPFVIGITCLVGALLLAWPTARFVAAAGRAQAAYVGPVSGPASRPRFRFTAADGTIVSFTARTGPAAGRYAPASRTPVWYDRANPVDARLGTIAAMWAQPLALGAAGAALLLAGALLARRWRQRGADTLIGLPEQR